MAEPLACRRCDDGDCPIHQGGRFVVQVRPGRTVPPELLVKVQKVLDEFEAAHRAELDAIERDLR